MVKHRGDDICGVLLLDKPSGRSSNFYLQRIKHLFNAKKAGHTGSLDPLATGLLPLCFGKATCLSEYFLHSDKAYEAVIQLGVTTDSHDCDGEVLSTLPVNISDKQFQETLQSFIGDIEQIPPMVSALKHKGQPLYKLALKGQEVERKPRKMTVFSLSGQLLENDQASIAVHCSSGFYVRQLAADIGEKLGCGAHIIALRRTSSKYLSVQDALIFDNIEAEFSKIDGSARQQRIKDVLLPPDDLLKSLPAVYTDKVHAEHVSHGRKIPIQSVQSWPEQLEANQHYRLYQSFDSSLVHTEQRHFLGIAEITQEDSVKVRRLFNSFRQ